MSIKGREFISAAVKCLELESEVGYRSSVSRAYYGFYHEVCSTLTCCPPTTHDGVIQYLGSDARRKSEPYELMSLIQLGAVLKQQKTKRKKADYELDETVTFEEAKASVATVEKMLTKIDDMKLKVA